ncbi:MAG: alpha-1,2-fucosyltransferase [Clostridium sp.]
MVIIKVMGGLGNQMFQYALYKAFLLKGKKVCINIDFYENVNSHNGYELESVFNLHPKIEKNWIIKHKYLGYVFRRLKEKSKILEQDFEYIDNIFDFSNNTLIGYWQNENYFKDIREELLKDFYYKINDEKNLKIQEKIKNTNSVSLHVRRGDYIDKLNKEKHYVIRNNNYYIRAIKYIEKRISNPHFFVFSDDITWVKENLDIPSAEFINWNTGTDSFKDMILMSKCKHNIIANSTFSWWGAWLNENKNKIIISPEVWLNNIDASNVICKDWIKISVD